MLPLALSLSVLIGVSLGLLGGGGSILTTPILMYALNVEPRAAIATSLLVVGITSVAGAMQHAARGDVAFKEGFIFGAAGMVGAYVGGRAAALVPTGALMAMFVGMMLATAAAMFRGRREVSAVAPSPLYKTLLLGAGVGAIAGLVGAGGGFLIVPALSLFGGLPMRRAVGTSLLVISLNSFAGFAGHLHDAPIDWSLAAEVCSAAVVGSFIGGWLSTRVAPAALRRGFAGLVLAMAAFVIYRQI